MKGMLMTMLTRSRSHHEGVECAELLCVCVCVCVCASYTTIVVKGFSSKRG